MITIDGFGSFQTGYIDTDAEVWDIIVQHYGEDASSARIMYNIGFYKRGPEWEIEDIVIYDEDGNKLDPLDDYIHSNVVKALFLSGNSVINLSFPREFEISRRS